MFEMFIVDKLHLLQNLKNLLALFTALSYHIKIVCIWGVLRIVDPPFLLKLVL
ncbi:hypothetical protein FQN55_004554, partial [Onygenales sp. PD_40]